jgi:hypothetical protein
MSSGLNWTDGRARCDRCLERCDELLIVAVDRELCGPCVEQDERRASELASLSVSELMERTLGMISALRRGGL